MNFPRADDADEDVTRRRAGAEETPWQQIAVAVVERDGKFLVGLRSPPQVLAGMSEFPGGKMRASESPARAAERECREETGLEVVAHERYSIVEHEYAHGRLVLHFFRCTLAESEAGKAPAAPFHWVEREELARLQFPEANRALVAELSRPARR